MLDLATEEELEDIYKLLFGEEWGRGPCAGGCWWQLSARHPNWVLGSR